MAWPDTAATDTTSAGNRIVIGIDNASCSTNAYVKVDDDAYYARLHHEWLREDQVALAELGRRHIDAPARALRSARVCLASPPGRAPANTGRQWRRR